MAEKRNNNVTEIHTDMIKRIAKQTGLYNYQVKEVMRAFIRCTLSDLAEGKVVSILSLGKFWLKRYEAGKVWNPIKQIHQDKGVRYIPKFRFGPTARDFIRDEAQKNIPEVETPRRKWSRRAVPKRRKE